MTREVRIIKNVPEYNLKFGDKVLRLEDGELGGHVCQIVEARTCTGAKVYKKVLLMQDEVEEL